MAGVPVAERSTDTAGVNTYNWLGTDAQGTALVEVDATTGVVAVRNQDPFGLARGAAAVWSSTHGFLNASGTLPGCAVNFIPELGCQAADAAIAAANDANGGGGASASSPGSGSTAKAAPKPKQVDWWNPTTWDANAWQTAAAIGAGIVATVAIVAVVVAATGCVVATLGVCGAVLLGAGIVAGAAGAAVTYGIQPGDKSADGLGQAVLWGGATGVVGVVGSALIGKALSIVGPKLLAALGKSGAATETVTSGAESSLNGAQLSEHLRQVEKYGADGFKQLESGRIRYHGDLTPASQPGEMIGRRLVREWDPSSGDTRTWHETLDGQGNVRIVRPETGGPKTHYSFDQFGNFGGSW